MIDFSTDTNIVFYAFDLRDPVKHRIANSILFSAYLWRSKIALQVLSEFYRSATRKLMQVDEAKKVVDDLRTDLTVVSAGEIDLVYAIELHQQHQLQFFDALLLATLARGGVRLLFSEDMQHGRAIGGVQIVNPFKLTPAELDLLLS